MNDLTDEATTSVRYHALDSVRAFAMLLGIVLHGGLSYLEHTPDYWPSDPDVSYLPLDVVMFWIHAFRMEAFFLMAGFFAALVEHRRGLREFVRHRARRVLLPFVLAFVALAPATSWLADYGIARLGAGLGHGEAVPHAAAFLVTAYPRTLDPGHLWFLAYLVVFYAVAAGLCALGPGGLARRVDTLIDRLATARGRVVWLAIPTTLLLVPMDNSYVDTPRGLAPRAHLLAYYGLFYALGWFMYRRRDWMDVTRSRKFEVWAAITAIPVALAFQWMINVAGAPDSVAIRAGAWISYALLTWSTIWAVLGIALRRVDTGDPRVRYVADSSYWFYLAHLPIVMGLQILLAIGGTPVHLRLAIVLLVTTCVLLASYEYLVRYTAVGRLLNGQRQRGGVSS